MLRFILNQGIRFMMHSPLDTLHTHIAPSQNPDANFSPFGENTKL